MSYFSFPEVRNRKETESGLGERPSMVHPKHPLHAHAYSLPIKPAGPIHLFTLSIPLALSIPCLIHSLKLANPLFIDPINPIDPISRLRDSKFYKQRKLYSPRCPGWNFIYHLGVWSSCLNTPPKTSRNDFSDFLVNLYKLKFFAYAKHLTNPTSELQCNGVRRWYWPKYWTFQKNKHHKCS